MSGVNLELWKWPQLPPSVNLSGALGICVQHRLCFRGGSSAAVRIVGAAPQCELFTDAEGARGGATATKLESKCTYECPKHGTCNEVYATLSARDMAMEGLSDPTGLNSIQQLASHHTAALVRRRR